MAVGDVWTEVIENPTSGSMKTAIELAVSQTNASGSLELTPIGGTSSILVAMIEQHEIA